MNRSLALVVVCLLTPACAPRARVAAVAPAPDALRSPSDALAAVRRREDSMRTLRTRFSSVFERGPDVRRAEGVVVVMKPDRFRLRLVSPLGFTVVDVLSAGGSTRLALPLEHKVLKDDEIARQQPFSAAELRPAFLRGKEAFPGECAAQGDGNAVLVHCRGGDATLLREIEIDPTTAVIRQETSFADGSPRLITRYSDFRPVDGELLPFVVQLSYPGQHAELTIHVQRYEINPALAEELFEAGS